ncbi:DUF2232 domain-containing protein [Paenibacillus sp. y28]|uniref:DUF2232 domain-containing protein n=1 Tax=Paenibacillus sp. y28 TaxID=3129110 RepID=UPI00301AE383
MPFSKKQTLLWSLIYLVLLFLSLTPLGLLTIHFVAIPPLILFVKNRTPVFAAAFVGSLIGLLAVSMLLQLSFIGYAGIMIAAFFLSPVVIMGTLYRKKAPARSAITAGVMTLLGQQLLMLVLLTLMGYNVTKGLRNYMQESMALSQQLLHMQLPQEVVDLTLTTMTQIIPMFLIAFAFYYTVITHWLGRKLLNRYGAEIPGLKPVREWMLPKSFVWIYLIALVCSFLFVQDSQSMLAVILMNLLPILTFTFGVQAVAFLSFVCYQKGWNYALPVLAFIFVIFPPFQTLLAMLGVFDVAFPIRERMKAK